MATRTFPKVSLVQAPPQVEVVRLRDLIAGDLVVEGKALEHRAANGATLRMDPVRAVSAEKRPFITITYGEGEAIGSARFVDVSRGLLRARGTSRTLAAELQQLFASAAPPGEQESTKLEAKATSELGTYMAPIGRSGRTIKWIFGILTIIAAVGALLTLSAGAFGGTSFFIALFIFSLSWYLYGRRRERDAGKAASIAPDPRGEGRGSPPG